MTPERVAYHRLMILAGFWEEYEKELDFMLETEDSITSPLLELALCMSDLNQTLSFLYNYTLIHPADDQQVYDMIVTELRKQYASKRLTANQVCDVLSIILHICEFGEPWLDLYAYLNAYELLEEEMIPQEVFEANFEAAFLYDKQIRSWAPKIDNNPKRRTSLLNYFRKRK